MGKYDPWDAFFAGLEGETAAFDLEDFERLTDVSLPPTAWKDPAWWSNVQYHAKWTNHGWYASSRLREGRILFIRTVNLPGFCAGSGFLVVGMFDLAVLFTGEETVINFR